MSPAAGAWRVHEYSNTSSTSLRIVHSRCLPKGQRRHIENRRVCPAPEPQRKRVGRLVLEATACIPGSRGPTWPASERDEIVIAVMGRHHEDASVADVITLLEPPYTRREVVVEGQVSGRVNAWAVGALRWGTLAGTKQWGKCGWRSLGTTAGGESTLVTHFSTERQFSIEC
jgi:hypothetical protein